MTYTSVSLGLETPGDDIRLRREGAKGDTVSDALALLVEMADEVFSHYGFEPMFNQVVGVDIVEAATDQPWTGGTEADPVPDGGLDLKLADRPDDWAPPGAEPEPEPQWYDHLPFVTGEVRQILAGQLDLSDPESLAALGEHSLRVAGQLGRQSLRATFERGAPQPDPEVRAVRRVDQLAAGEPQDVLFVRNASTGEWEAQGIDGDTYRYRWSDIIAFSEAVDCSDEHRYGVRQPLPGQVVVVDLAKAREGTDDSSFEVEDISEAWRVVNELHAAAAPPQVLARRATKTERQPTEKNQEDNR
jgi:hypothetical protein